MLNRKKSTRVAINDIVPVYEEKQPRHLWRMGKINRLIAGKDGCARGAEIKIGKTGATIRGPVNKLYPLLTKEPEDEKMAKFSKKRHAADLGELRRKCPNED